jgi:hypothetical protein
LPGGGCRAALCSLLDGIRSQIVRGSLCFLLASRPSHVVKSELVAAAVYSAALADDWLTSPDWRSLAGS